MVYDVILDVLVPLLGRPMAVMCLVSAGVRLGKPAEEFAWSDLDGVLSHVRESLEGVTTPELLDDAFAEFERKAG